MALMSVSRPGDQSFSAMATPAPVNLSSKKKVKAAYEWEDVNAPDRGMNGKVKNKGKRVRVSDTSGNVTAGGPGSGRKKEVEDYLKSKGFEQHKVFNRNTGKSGDDNGGNSHWHKTISSNIHGTQNNQGNTVHTVMVSPDGSWSHTVTGVSHGHPSDVAHMPFAASTDSISGTTLISLQRILAKAFKESKRKSLAKKGKALPDGSFPIENKQDLKNAKYALGRSKHPAAARRLINKRAKELGAPKLNADSIPSKNEDAIEYYSKGKRVKALGEANLTNKKIMKFMEDQSAFASGDLVKTKHGNGRVQGHIDNKVYLVKTRAGNKHIHASELKHTHHKGMTLTCATGKISIKSGGPGSGRHITVSTKNPKEIAKIHDTLINQGFKMTDKNNYEHKNGDKVTMNYKAGGTGSGRKTGMKLGNMLRQALVKRMSKALQIANKPKSEFQKFHEDNGLTQFTSARRA